MNSFSSESYKNMNLEIKISAQLIKEGVAIHGKGIHPIYPKERCLMSTEEFLKFFNHDHKLSGSEAISRRTLQYYCSPQARLFPLPVYKNRHTAHYVFPDHYMQLCAIWKLRQGSVPIKQIRFLLKDLPGEMYPMVVNWRGNPLDLVDIVPLHKAGFAQLDMLNCHCVQTLVPFSYFDNRVLSMSDEKIRKYSMNLLKTRYGALAKWIMSGRWAGLLRARRAVKEAQRAVVTD